MYGKDGSQLTASQISDVNGNQISASLDVTDTLGLKAAHVGAWYGFTAPVSWTDVSGGNPEVNFTTSSKTLKTSFGCTSPLITDLNNTTANALLTGLSFPDGSSIALSYEITPNNSPKVTGRLNQITLREGGTISYTYSGGTHNGIDCTLWLVKTSRTVKSTSPPGVSAY